MQKSKTYDLVILAIMSALIIILAFVPYLGYIPLPILGIQATTIHIPVIVGSICLGPKKGAFLGFLFGLTSLLNNTMAPKITSFVFSPFVTVGEFSGNWLSLIICLVPRILIGVIPYFVCKCFKNREGTLALSFAGIAGSLTNTLLVMNMIYLFFGNEYAAATGKTASVLYGYILSIISINGVLEAIVASILATVICKAIKKTI